LIPFFFVPDLMLHQVQVVVRVEVGKLPPDKKGISLPHEITADFDWLGFGFFGGIVQHGEFREEGRRSIAFRESHFRTCFSPVCDIPVSGEEPS
jgi:hypothetical protein